MRRCVNLFDVNGQIGGGCRGEPEFATARDLLRHMDRLGIARALAWQTAARDQHPIPGNQRLLAELRRVDPAGARLVPSFVIGPCLCHENGSMGKLIGALRDGTVRALRMFPNTMRYRLHHLAPLLEQVAAFKPVLFLDVREIGDDRELTEFAQSFPHLPVVVLHGMWGHFFNFSLLDVLRRCPNVRVDNSVMHTTGTIASIVRELGAHRVLFGTQWKAHNGASIAGLQQAGISGADRERIAHGNLEELLGMPLAPRLVPARSRSRVRANGLWEKFRAGKPLGVEILDAHGHLGPVAFWFLEEVDVKSQIRKIALPVMDALGIRTMLVSSEEALFGDPVVGNVNLEAAAARSGGRFRGYFSFNPFYAPKLTPLFDKVFDRSFFVGFKILCDYWQVPVTDRRFEPALRYAHEHRLPILFHTWDTCYDSPAMLKDLAREFPEAIFLLGHSGGGDRGRREAEELANANPNVYLEWCGSFCSRIPWEETLRTVGPEKVVFGTDGIFHDLAWELGRFLSLDLPEELLIPALGANMRHILARRRWGGRTAGRA